MKRCAKTKEYVFEFVKLYGELRKYFNTGSFLLPPRQFSTTRRLPSGGKRTEMTSTLTCSPGITVS